MFDIGWTEMLVIAVVMIVVVGPKDLPKMLRTFGKTTAKLRAMAGDFQRQFNEALKEAELDDVKKSVDELRSLNPASTIRKHLNPFEQAGQDLKAGMDTLKSPAAKPATPISEQPASADVHPAEPLKNAATDLPGVSGPESMPAAPLMTPLNGAAPPAAATPAVAAEVVSANPAPEKPATKKAKAAPKAAAKPPAAARANSKAPTAKAAASRPKAAAAKAKAPTKSVAAKPATRKKADAP